MLHTIHNSPFDNGDLESCLRVARPGDDLLLYEDAVIAGVRGNDFADRLEGLTNDGINISVLSADLAARGIPEARLGRGITVVDHDGFVALVEKHSTVQAW